MKLSLSFLLVLLAPIAAHAAAPQINDLKIIDYGVYASTNVSTTAAPDTATGQVITAADAHLVTQTQIVPAKQGEKFGFHYVLEGAPQGAIATLHFVTIFPAPGLTNPATGQTSTQSDYDDTVSVGVPVYKGYELTNPWEVRTGAWTMQVWYEGRKIAEQAFTLVAP